MAKYFTERETIGLVPELVELLDEAREIAGVPFVITSGYRTPAENQAAGGVSESAHESGKAVDLACNDGLSRFKMVYALLFVGCRRVGVYNHHIHADVDETKVQDVIWTGLSN